MDIEADFGIDAKKEAATVDFFQQADARFPQDRTVLTPLVGGGHNTTYYPSQYYRIIVKYPGTLTDFVQCCTIMYI